ncbi:alanine racemase [Streptomyces sp. SID3343]|uniref:alanine racemase n=1 Tax=Streptomyces sp. SID3343 TaxID=2690260 RepID=UPI00136C6497|nr:alanine racemase [Streptomyces sp. SID3343]MYW05230.1 alanine racemase [Streptomyces sp. SID3343]
MRAQARIDLDAIVDNIAAVRARVGSAAVMAVVKSNAYGHGMVPCARAARSGGAQWLGTAVVEEALALRAAGDTGRVLTWLWAPGDRFEDAVRADVDISVSGEWAMDEVVAAARAAGRPARVHLKADTGLGRNGCTPGQWPSLVDAALKAQADGLADVVGLWSHFACADEPGHPSIAPQLAEFRAMVGYAEDCGVTPEVRHMANSPATLLMPEAHFDLVRVGLAGYGLSPVPDIGGPADFGLRPAMTLVASLANVKRVPAGHGVSYGHAWIAPRETTLALVPTGYADGIPRHASNVAPVLVAGRVRTIAGRVAMDQFVVDLGDDEAEVGDEVILFGPGDRGEPTAEDWAVAVGTISYEIVTRLGARVPRVYSGADASEADATGTDATGTDAT